MSRSGWVVHKFGGTSVANPERYRKSGEIALFDREVKKAIVVSAMSGVTDGLIQLAVLAQERDESYLSKLELLKNKHLMAAKDLLGSSADLEAVIARDFESIREILRGVWHGKNAPERTVELVSGFGEVWSAQLMNGYLRSKGVDSAWLDAREVLIVEPLPKSVVIDWAQSQSNLDQWISKHPNSVLVITGFVASTGTGIATTLRRNGSDYSASIFGALLDAHAITIWTDVDGVLSADPRLVPDAVVLDELSYQEATELAYFGAKVVHPSTMTPAIKKGIPVWIRNAFNAEFPGTKIHGSAKSSKPVKGFATIDRMAVINVEGTGMIGVPGVAERLFGALRTVDVSVVMISQASSEHSICIAVPEDQMDLAKSTIEKAFFGEIYEGRIESVGVIPGSSILAIVGDNMVDQPGVAGTFFTALGNSGVNVRAIAQGSSERNISVVVSAEESKRALRAVHSAFYLSNQTISVGLIGPGLIGSTLLKQLQEQAELLKKERGIDFRVRGILNTNRAILNDDRINLVNWKAQIEKEGLKLDLEKFADHIHAAHIPHAVIVDCTSSEIIPQYYVGWLKRGIHIVTPNKKGNSGSIDLYREIHRSARNSRRHYLYETTVGAGLPVISTLRDLVQTGDRVIQIDGVLSGTLSYIFSTFSSSTPFSKVVRQARSLGYTEPDPRDDLSGADVARKLVILARESGLTINTAQIAVENLVPEELRSGSVEKFLTALSKFDEKMNIKLDEAGKQGSVLRYVGLIEANGKASVKLAVYPKDHAFSRIGSGDNIFAFKTDRYQSQPLIVQGPGAGPEVTAAGVFSDLLRLVSYLGAPQ